MLKLGNKGMTKNGSMLISKEELLCLCVSFMAFFSPIGATVFSIDIGVGKISQFRLFLLLSFATMCSIKKLRLWNRCNKYSVCFFTCWLMYSFFSILWARDFGGFVRMAFFLIIAMATIILVNNIGEIDGIIKVMYGMNLGIMVQGVLGLIEYFSGNYMYLSEVNQVIYNEHGLRYPVAMLGNPNDFATLMYLGVVISCYLFLMESVRKTRKFFNFLLIMIYTYLIIVGQSRATLLGLLLATGFFFFVSMKKKNKVLFFFLIIILLPILIPMIIPHLDLDYFFTKGESFSARVNLIRNGLAFLVDTMGFGVGNGQIEHWMSNYGLLNTNGITDMHNFWFEILVAYGVFIFIGFLVFYFKMIIDFYKVYSQNRRLLFGKGMLVFCAGVFGLFMTLISSSSNLTKEYVWLFWAICIANQGMLNINSDEKNRIVP